MNIINQSVEILNYPIQFAKILERAARTCTGTCEQINPCDEYGAEEFVKRVIMGRKHYSVLEHVHFTFELVTSRAIANQIVRHRMAAYCQESMRYVKLSRKDGGVHVIKPYGFDSWTMDTSAIWHESVSVAEDNYNALLQLGIKAEDARGVLPLDTATTLVATWNLRELFHILYHPVSGRLTNKHAQPQIRELFGLLEDKLKDFSPFMYHLLEIYKQDNEGHSK